MDEASLARTAAILDEAASSSGHYSLALRLRELLQIGVLEDVDEGVRLESRAAAWAFEYHLDVQRENGQRRIRLVPRQEVSDGS